MRTRRSRKLKVLSRLALPMVWLLVARPVFAFDAICAFGDSLTDTSDSPEPATDRTWQGLRFLGSDPSDDESPCAGRSVVLSGASTARFSTAARHRSEWGRRAVDPRRSTPGSDLHPSIQLQLYRLGRCDDRQRDEFRRAMDTVARYNPARFLPAQAVRK